MTNKGSRNWLVIFTQFIWALVSVMRRSSRSFGRMEIKSSSEASQFTAFKARSRLPLKPMKEFAAQLELPTTTKRPCEFSFPVLWVPAAAIAKGPLVLLGSVGSIAALLSFMVARLDSDELKRFVTVLLSLFLVSRDRASGKPVARRLMSLTMAWDS